VAHPYGTDRKTGDGRLHRFWSCRNRLQNGDWQTNEMFWNVVRRRTPGRMFDLRCAFLSDRLDAFCQARAANRAARNDLLKFAG